MPKSSGFVNFSMILTMFTFILISAVLVVIISTPPATGYEISIYDAYPISFWVLLITTIACGIVILIHQAFDEKLSRWWMAGFSVILFSNLLILLLPVARGYVTFGRADVLAHIGYIAEILFTGHFPLTGPKADYYPALHILCADLSLATGLTPEQLAELIPVLFFMFYIISIYLLAKEVATHWRQVLLITTFGSLLLFQHNVGNVMLAPAVQCFYLCPFTLFLFFKTQKIGNNLSHALPFILTLLFLPLFHPGEGSAFMILIFMCLGFSSWLYRRIKKTNQVDETSVMLSRSISFFMPGLILFTIWFVWFSSFFAFARTIIPIWEWVIYHSGPTTAINYGAILAEANLSSIEFMKLFFKMYGQIAIHCLFGLVISIAVWNRFLMPKKKITPPLFIFSILFIVFGILLFVAFFSNIWVNYNRAMRYVIFTATFLNGFGLYCLSKKRYKKISTIFLTITLIIITCLGVFNTFPSPLTIASNSQVTKMEMTGTSYFLAYQDNNLPVHHFSFDPVRFISALIGHQNITQNILSATLPIDHFGYAENKTYGESYAINSYFVDSQISRLFYPILYPEYENLWRFTPRDFQKLDHYDPSVSRTYSNGEFWVYYVQGTGSSP